MSFTERHQKILEALCLRRYDTYKNMAQKFGVSERTICNDIGNLMCIYPLETVRGRCGVGVRVMDGYYFSCRPTFCKSLNKDQTAHLKELRKGLSGSKLDTLNSILV